MIHKDQSNIEISDFQQLIDNSIVENKVLEYKQELKLERDADKKEFLADITALSNTDGGQIIYGIKEEKGIPTEITGTEIHNIDIEIQKIENLLRDGVEPRISSVEIIQLNVTDNRYVLLFKIPRSWNSPHRVNFKGSNKFYGRNSNGKYLLDVTELREAFTLSETLSTKLTRFREERISKILLKDTPKPLDGTSSMVLHILPLNSFNAGQTIDLTLLKQKPDYSRPLASSGWDYHYNFDGYVSFSGRGDKVASYTQFFKNGIIEAVIGNITFNKDQINVIPSREIVEALFTASYNYLEFLERSNINYPLFLSLTFLNCDGSYLSNLDGSTFYLNNPIDRKTLIIPELLVESKPEDIRQTFKPILNTLWNTCGYEQCYIYNN